MVCGGKEAEGVESRRQRTRTLDIQLVETILDSNALRRDYKCQYIDHCVLCRSRLRDFNAVLLIQC